MDHIKIEGLEEEGKSPNSDYFELDPTSPDYFDSNKPNSLKNTHSKQLEQAKNDLVQQHMFSIDEPDRESNSDEDRFSSNSDPFQNQMH